GVAPADKSVLADTDLEPCRQPLDVRGEDVLAADGDAHLEERADKAVVGGLAARAVDRRDGDAEVVDPLRTIADVAELRALLAVWRNPFRSSVNVGRLHWRVC